MTFKHIRSKYAAGIKTAARYSRQDMDGLMAEILHTEGIQVPYGTYRYE